MKTILTKFIFLMVFMNAMSIMGQSVTPPVLKDSLRNVTQKYLFDTRRDLTYTDANLLAYQNANNDKKTEIYYDKLYYVFNPKMLNVFFENEINAFSTSIKELSTDKYIVSANTTAKTLTIGRTIDLRIFNPKRERPLLPLHNLVTFSIENKYDQGFSAIYSEDRKLDKFNFSSDFGVGLKYVFIGNGWINYSDNDKNEKKEKIKKIREQVIFPTVNGDIDKYIKYDKVNNSTTTNQDEEINKIIHSDIELSIANENKVAEKYFEFYKSIADKEIEILKKEKLYRSYATYWVGFDSYYGLEQKKISSKETAVSNTISENKFRNYKVDIFFNYLRSYSCGTTFNVKGVYNISNTNNFIVDKIAATEFETITSLPNNQQITSDTKSLFIGDYDDFITYSSRFELSFLTFNNTVGLSSAIEHFYGTYKARNWKVGIPVSFKDSKSQPTLNFELQWKEVNKLHYIGITVGFPFGKFLK